LGNFKGFAYEDGSLVYSDQMNTNVKALPDGTEYNLVDFTQTIGASSVRWQLQYYKGNLLYLELNATDEDLEYAAKIRTLRIGEDEITLVPTAEEAAEMTPVEEKGTVTVAQYPYSTVNIINARAIQKNSGIKTLTIEVDGEDAFILKMLGGDDDVDVYVTNAYPAIMSNAIKGGFYTPLNESETVSNYVDAIFKPLRDYVTTENGDIAGIPIFTNVPALWYMPESFTRLGLSTDDFDNLDEYYDVCLRMSETVDVDEIEFSIIEYYKYLCHQYEELYRDPASGDIDFNTDLFKNLLEKMWGGWERVDPEISTFYDQTYDWRHPVFDYYNRERWRYIGDYQTRLQQQISDAMAGNYWEMEESVPKYDILESNETIYYPDKGVFSLEEGYNFVDKAYRSTLSGLAPVYPPIDDNWRVISAPGINDEIDTGYYSSVAVMMINPYSKNKELAMEYIEAVARDVYGSTTRAGFLFEDTAAYEGVFDMSKDFYKDAYEIYKNAEVMEQSFFYFNFYTGVEEYQNGELTLDETVAEISRQYRIFNGE
jgi:ABC-type glycerol-3-phosphate transport system substrate-binding protein